MQAYLHLRPPEISSEQPPPPPERPPHPHTLACCKPRKPAFLFKVVKTKQVFPMPHPMSMKYHHTEQLLLPNSPILYQALCNKFHFKAVL